VFEDDPRGATEAVLSMTGMPSHVDVAALEVAIGRIMATYRRAEMTGGGLDRLVEQLLAMMRDFQLHLPTEISVLLTTLGMVDGVASQIDPGYRMVDAARPFARKLVPQQYGPERMLKASMRSLRAYGRFFDELPVQATRVMRRAGEGEFRVSVRPTDYQGAFDRLQQGFLILAYALIVGALIVGSSFLVAQPGLSETERIGCRIVLVAAIASIVWLVVKMGRAEWRKRRQDKRAAG
jgi:ubiquinone biosynthesis protein